jgi:hypothetical protein
LIMFPLSGAFCGERHVSLR